MSFYCPECDAPLPAQTTFCLECGKRTDTLAAPATIDMRRMPGYGEAFMPASAPVTIDIRQAPGLAHQPLAQQAPNAAAVEPSILQQWLTQLNTAERGPTPDFNDLAIKGVYFLLIGVWMSQLWIALAWMLSLTVVGLPLSSMLLSYLPQIAFLSNQKVKMVPLSKPQGASPVPLIVRAAYFVFFGWWLSLLWMQLAWVAGLTVVGLPISRAMVGLTPMIATLARP